MAIFFEGKVFDLLPGETVLEALERQGARVPSFCRSGVCQSCVLAARRGAVPARAQKGLKVAHQRQGFFLSCVCQPSEDLEVVRPGISERVPARIERVERLTADVLSVSVRPSASFAFEAGQYVQLERTDDGLMRPYSIASLPSSGGLELHVACLPGGAMSGWLPGAAGAEIGIRGPFGECSYVPGEPDRPLLLAGTGTGLAPLLGVVRAALAAGHRGPIRLYHGSPTPAGLYLWSELARLAVDAENLEVTGSVLSAGELPPPSAGGRCQVVEAPLDRLVLEAALEFREQRVYLCGHHELVRKLQKKAYLLGTPLERIHADPFVAPAARA